MNIAEIVTTWVTVCPLSAITPGMGVAALVDGHQVAIFRLKCDEVYAVSNYDPFSEAFVLSRGIIGDRGGEIKVASPIYKQSFSLITGQCLDDPAIRLRTYPAQIVDGMVQIGIH